MFEVKDFEALRARTISLVGMSGVGKSHWSGLLDGREGFTCYCIDDMIEDELGSHLQAAGFSGGIEEVAAWMGKPYEKYSQERQDEYRILETNVMVQVLRKIAAANRQVVIDCTGSVVHTDAAVQRLLKERTTVVYLETGAEGLTELFKIFLAEPKPIIWGECFTQRPGETHDEAIARCYADLLAQRSRLYKKLAAVTLSWEVHKAKDFSVEKLLLAVAASTGFSLQPLLADS